MTQSSMHLPPLRQGRKAWHTDAADTRRAERQPGPEPPWGRCCATCSCLASTHGCPGLGDGRLSSSWGPPRCSSKAWKRTITGPTRGLPWRSSC